MNEPSSFVLRAPVQTGRGSAGGVVSSRAKAGGRWRAHPDLPALILGVIVALAVCWPFAAGGRVYLLDWVIGPHAAILPRSFFGLDGGLTTGVPLQVAMGLANRLLGPVATWLPIAAFFPLASVAASRLVGNSFWARLGGAALYSVNPFVFQRLYAGQIALLLGYALLPFVVRSMVRAVDARGPSRLAPVLWMALLTGMSPHFAWICGVLLLSVALCDARRLARLAWAALVGLCFLATLAYVFLPSVGSSLPARVGQGNLTAFQTSSDPHVGLFANVGALYGFWRLGPGPVLPKDVVTGWPFLWAAMAVVAVAGATGAVAIGRRRAAAGTVEPVRSGERVGPGPDRRVVARVVFTSAAGGYFLALGSQGPTGPIFRWAYDHLPYFDVMREPEKFSMLVALGFAAGFGWGVERLTAGFAHRGRPVIRAVSAALVAIGLPFAYTPTIIDGLSGQVAPSALPGSWAKVQTLTAHRTGALLFLPWHEYLSFPFTGNRVIANPAGGALGGEVISGTNIQLRGVTTGTVPPRSVYIERILGERGAGGPVGESMASLGVQYIALAKTVDWRSYGWLSAQPTLRLVLDTPGVDLWENLSYRGIGSRGGRPVVRLSPVAYRVPPGRPGIVSVAVPYQPGWVLDGAPAGRTSQGTLAVPAGPRGGILRFDPWHFAVWGDVISAVLLLLLLLCVVPTAKCSGCARRRSDADRKPWRSAMTREDTKITLTTSEESR